MLADDDDDDSAYLAIGNIYPFNLFSPNNIECCGCVLCVWILFSHLYLFFITFSVVTKRAGGFMGPHFNNPTWFVGKSHGVAVVFLLFSFTLTILCCLLWQCLPVLASACYFIIHFVSLDWEIALNRCEKAFYCIGAGVVLMCKFGCAAISLLCWSVNANTKRFHCINPFSEGIYLYVQYIYIWHISSECVIRIG